MRDVRHIHSKYLIFVVFSFLCLQDNLPFCSFCNYSRNSDKYGIGQEAILLRTHCGIGQ